MKETLLHPKPTRRQHLENHISRIDRRIDDLRARSDRFVRIRVAIVIVSAVLVFLAFSQVSDTAGYASFVVALVVFNLVARVHRQIKHSITRHSYLRRIKATHIARMTLDWPKLPESHATAPNDHPFCA